MSTHNICFCGEIRDISIFWMKKSALSVAMSELELIAPDKALFSIRK